MNHLTWIILIPLFTILLLLFTKDPRRIRIYSAAGMGAQLLYSVFLVVKFLSADVNGIFNTLMFETLVQWFQVPNIQYHVGVDGISVSLVLLTAIVIFTGVLASWRIQYRVREFFISLILLSLGAFGFFISLDLFLMFFFFELAVIPMFLLIGVWGSGAKEYSTMKLTLMLMGGSALLLVGILGLYFHSAPQGGGFTFDLMQISRVQIPLSAQRLFFPLTFVGFGVIGALFPLHTWSPDGHSAAPTAASMLHAGVLMKLGGYGCLKVATFLMPEAAAEMAWIFIILATIGVIYGAFATIRQTDLKYINAYSSVSHCGLVLLGILMFTKTAVTGAVLQMISHGIMTALFFALIGMIYERTKTRSVPLMGGLLKSLPFLSSAFIIAGLCSLGLPGLSGFVAEISIFTGAFQVPDLFHRVVTVIAILSILVAAVYILKMVGSLQLGPLTNKQYARLKDGAWNEKLAAVLLLTGIIGMGVFPLWISDMIGNSVQPLLEQLTRLTFNQ